MKNDKVFPDNWREIIQGKKVIFYNTSVTGMLSGREKRLEKMRWVFGVFQEYPEVVLWWRPHPLELSTIRSMIPELEEPYRELRRQYQEECVGILDESTDLNRAIAISDAYYGDWSSVVQLYKAAGKPVLYENDKILNRCRELSYHVMDFVVVDRNVWFLSSTINILFSMNLDTFELTEIIKIPYGNISDQYASSCIAKVEHYLVLIPGCGKWIIRFDLDERKFDGVQIGDRTVSIKFGAYSVYHGYIYMLPAFENRIIKYDVIHNRIICEKEIREKKNTLFLENNMDTFASYIYAVESGGAFIYKYNMEDDSYKKIRIPGEDIHLSGIKKIRDLFLLILSNQNEILLWDEKENRTWKLEGIPQWYPVKYRPYGDFVEYEEDVYLFPEQADRAVKINTGQMVLEQCLEIEENKSGGDEIYFTRAKNIDGGILAFDCLHNQWIVANLERKAADKHSVVMKEEVRDKIAGYSIFERDDTSDKRTEVWEEDKALFSLYNYIKDVACRNAIEWNVLQKEPIGKKIFETITADIYEGGNM